MKWYLTPFWFFGMMIAIFGAMSGNWYWVAVGGIIAISTALT